MHDVIKRCWNSIETLLLRVPLVYKITSWYSIFLLLMIGLLATFVIQFTHIWDQNEIRTDLQEAVIESASDPKKFKPFDDGIFLLVYTHDGVVLRGNLPDLFESSEPFFSILRCSHSASPWCTRLYSWRRTYGIP